MDGPSSTDAKNLKLKTIRIDGWRKGINRKDEGLKVLSIFELKQSRTQFLKSEIFGWFSLKTSRTYKNTPFPICIKITVRCFIFLSSYFNRNLKKSQNSQMIYFAWIVLIFRKENHLSSPKIFFSKNLTIYSSVTSFMISALIWTRFVQWFILNLKQFRNSIFPLRWVGQICQDLSTEGPSTSYLALILN